MTVTVDYMVLMWMVIILFGLVGFYRGWWKEGLTTGFLTLLVILLQFPGLAEAIISTLNKLIKLVYVVLKARTLDIERIAEVAREIGEPPIKIDPAANETYLVALVGLLVISYIVGRVSISKKALGPSFLGALFGTIFGLLNGFTVVSLVREYVVGRYLPDATEDVVAQAATTTTIALSVEDMPMPSVMEGLAPWLLVSIGAVALFAVLATRWSVERTKIKDVAPPLYRKTPEPTETTRTYVLKEK
jgi:uncharacterized membrane protein required for colicin V production